MRAHRLTRPLVAASLVLTVVAAAAGCAKGGANSGAADTVVFGSTDGGTTYVRNFNVVSPATDKAPGASMIYEPLTRIDYSDGAVIKPWLAESWEFDATGKTLTFALRTDVAFSDGAKMTADDVAYSLSLPLENPQFNAAGATYKTVATTDETHVAVTFGAPAFSELKQFASLSLPVVPKAIWSTQDLSTWTNPDPVGTGPFTLDKFAAQQVTLAARDDYWGGDLPMKTFKIVATNKDAVKAQLLRGEVDWGPISWSGAQQEYVDIDPEKHLYQLYANGGAYSVLFNTAKAPFDDVHVRRALSMTIDRTAIVTTLNRPGTEAGPTGLVDQVYADWLRPEYKGVVQPVDATAAQAELAAGGWSVADGKLVKDGESYEPSLSFNQDWGWADYANLMIGTWKDTLGLDVKPVGAPGATLYDQQKAGDFDLTIVTTGGAGVYGVYSFLSSRFLKPLGESAAANNGRWNDPETDALLDGMSQTDDVDELKALAQDVQKIVVDEVPFSPIYNSYYFVNINASKWTNWPTPESFTAIPFPSSGPDATLTLLGLQPRQ